MPTRRRGKLLFWAGFTVSEIALMLGAPYGTVNGWKKRDRWEEADVASRVAAHTEHRLCQLIAKPVKSARDFHEIDSLSKLLERTARIERYRDGGNEVDLNPKLAARAAGRKTQAQKNTLTEGQVAALVGGFEESLFDYQRVWRTAYGGHRIRSILKSRQIGATWYFAREALISAITTGDDQIFLSASKAQAHVFRNNILDFVAEVTGVQLSGDPIKLWNGATLRFLGTSARTAQSYNGHVYCDEIFWIPKFREFRKVISGMATHKKWKQTYVSTPSSIGHQAYPFWTGAQFNEGRADADHVDIDVSHAALKEGISCPDGQWRQIVTIEDAIAGGLDLVDLEQLRLEYNDQEFENLFLCQFVDDHVSFFKLDHLQKCMVDSWTLWEDVDPFADQPYAGPVFIGYDPSRSRDAAAIVVVAPPIGEGRHYRVIERLTFNDVDFETQATAIRRLCDKYNVVHIGIDKSTIGVGVFELVKQFFPAVIGINYATEVKTTLVLRAYQLISRGLLQFDSGWSDLAMAFLTIKRAGTASGNAMTFQASRTAETGHADQAFALMHALHAEKITPSDGTRPVTAQPFVRFFS